MIKRKKLQLRDVRNKGKLVQSVILKLPILRFVILVQFHLIWTPLRFISCFYPLKRYIRLSSSLRRGSQVGSECKFAASLSPHKYWLTKKLMASISVLLLEHIMKRKSIESS